MGKKREIQQENSKSMTFRLDYDLYERMERFLESPVARVRTKTEIFNRAVKDYLDREEPICKELELVREVIESKLSRMRG